MIGSAITKVRQAIAPTSLEKAQRDHANAVVERDAARLLFDDHPTAQNWRVVGAAEDAHTMAERILRGAERREQEAAELKAAADRVATEKSIRKALGSHNFEARMAMAAPHIDTIFAALKTIGDELVAIETLADDGRRGIEDAVVEEERVGLRIVPRRRDGSPDLQVMAVVHMARSQIGQQIHERTRLEPWPGWVHRLIVSVANEIPVAGALPAVRPE